ncbi:hypothetical protein SETIT_2G225700v2 [Setaria italica]|uniref:Uncharacterized protein n=1 Tax=Setaria italica TaxID=4555 RepID=A0A368Q215_SETIT|nr:hypothetical protein SETIT_2G225700v2 [Setaria italica]
MATTTVAGSGGRRGRKGGRHGQTRVPLELRVRTGGGTTGRRREVESGVPIKHFNSYLLLICWRLWKQRNNLIFNGVPPSSHLFWVDCKEDALLWRHRLPVADNR